ncbi:MAG: hypothetical protein F4Z85_14485 [Gemmatimonadetes bacterium]|nr:hypothetical protein [Gemmatimonadota bacterium]MYB71417.1 hypothetical protein [Gemmatimonadota bacterium]
MNRTRLAGDAAGPHNAIVDVAGVSVGYVDIRTPDLRLSSGVRRAQPSRRSLHTGLTAIVPYPASVEERKLFIGRFSIDDGDAMSGLGVAEDFGTFSSPIVLAPTPVVGRVYESLIRHSLGRDTGLSTVAGWPPVVVGIDDTAVNDPALVRKVLTHAHADEALASAGSVVPTGNAGVGGGLQAFGYKGGVGTASRRAGEYALGVLAAVNGGRELYWDGRVLPVGERTEGPQTFAAVVATDAPLIPRQLERLAGRAALGLARTGLWNPHTREGLVLAFSTTGIIQEPDAPVKIVGEEKLYSLFAAGAAAAEDSVVDALLAAETVGDLKAMPQTGWLEEGDD